jgi:hypothetical protein
MQQTNMSFVKKKGWLVLLLFFLGGQHKLCKEIMVFMKNNHEFIPSIVKKRF